jgi:hypothetical protein
MFRILSIISGMTEIQKEIIAAGSVCRSDQASTDTCSAGARTREIAIAAKSAGLASATRMSAPAGTVSRMDVGGTVYTVGPEASALSETARRILEAEAARFGVSLETADVPRRRDRRDSPMYVMAAADELVRYLRAVAYPLAENGPLMVLAHAGALAQLSMVELDGNARVAA